jgi:hypothetical protein
VRGSYPSRLDWIGMHLSPVSLLVLAYQMINCFLCQKKLVAASKYRIMHLTNRFD